MSGREKESDKEQLEEIQRYGEKPRNRKKYCDLETGKDEMGEEVLFRMHAIWLIANSHRIQSGRSQPGTGCN